MSINKVTTPILRGLFHEKFNDAAGNIGLEAAPARKVDAINGSYLVYQTPSVLNLAEGGFDATIPLSLRAPSRDTTVEFDTRMFSVERQAYNQVLTDLEAMHMETAGAGSPNEQINAAMKTLARKFSDLHAYQVGRLYNDDANFGTNVAGLDLTDASADVAGAIEDAVNGVKQFSGGAEVVIVLNQKTAAALRGHASILALTAAGNFGGQISTQQGLRQIFVDHFGAKLLISSTKVYNGSNVVDAVADDTLAVAAISGSSQFEASFAHTVTVYDDVEGLVDVYMFEEYDPRGVKVVAESVYKVEVADEAMGFRFTVTQ